MSYDNRSDIAWMPSTKEQVDEAVKAERERCIGLVHEFCNDHGIPYEMVANLKERIREGE